MAVATIPAVCTEQRDDNLDSYSLFWLDSSKRDNIQEYLDGRNRLRKLMNYLEISVDIDQIKSNRIGNLMSSFIRIVIRTKRGCGVSLDECDTVIRTHDDLKICL